MDGQPLSRDDVESTSATLDPSGAAEPRATNPQPSRIPGVGESVGYHLRAGDYRARRNVFPALVAHVGDDGRLDLVVFYEANDVINIENVAFHDGTEPGWMIPATQYRATDAAEPPAADLVQMFTNLQETVDRLRSATFGGYDMPTDENDALLSHMASITDRMDALEKAVSAAKALNKPTPKSKAKAK